MANKIETVVQVHEINVDQDNDSHPLTPSSPMAPKNLTATKYEEWGLTAYDTALCLVPLLLIVKVLLCIVAHKKDSWATGSYVDDASSLTKQLIRLNDQLTTAFTIIFVMIVTTFLRRLALWRVQAGESVARLEQFQASSSLPSTLKLILSLRSFNLVSLGLVVGWSFYYIGSQASSREYTLQSLHSYGHHGKFGVIYQRSDAPSYYTSSRYADEGLLSQSQQRLQSQAYVLAVPGTTPMIPTSSDMFGNANIPYLSIDGSPTDTYGNPYSGAPVDKNGWFVLAHDQLQSTAYATYAGIPFFSQPYLDGAPAATGPTAVSGSYTTNSSYFTLSCDIPQTFSAARFPLGANSTTDFTLIMSNTTLASPTGPMRAFEIWQRSQSTYSMSKCGIALSSIESQIHCDGHACVVQKYRRTRSRPPTLQTPFDDPTFATRLLHDFALSADFINLVTYWPQVSSALASLATPYPSPLDAGFSTTFSYQMSQLLNTFWYNSQVGMYPDALCRGCIGGDAGLAGLAAGSGSGSGDATFQRTTMNGSIYNPAYMLNWAWITCDILSNTLLLLAATAAFWLRKHTLTPDIFGYVSSLTRDNPNLSVPEGGTAMGGLERSRMIGHVRVRFVDVGVEGTEGVGRIVLADADVEKGDGEELRRGRVYV